MQLVFEDEGEGWPSDLVGQAIEASVVREVDVPGEQPYYEVHFEPPVELQERSCCTPSGLTLNVYSSGWVRSRHVDRSIGEPEPVSAYVWLSAQPSPPPQGLPRLWASCRRGTL